MKFFQGYHKPLDCFYNWFLAACVVLNHELSNRSKQEMQNLTHKISEERVKKLQWSISKERTETNFPGVGNDLGAIINYFENVVFKWSVSNCFIDWSPFLDYPKDWVVTVASVTVTNLCDKPFLGREKFQSGQELNCAKGETCYRLLLLCRHPRMCTEKILPLNNPGACCHYYWLPQISPQK